MLAAVYLEANTKPKTALKYVDEQLEKQGLDLEMLVLKSRILLWTKDYEGALKTIADALEISPEDEELLMLRAKVLDARVGKAASSGKKKKRRRRPKVPQVIRLGND